MARFILDYDTQLNVETKVFITENCKPSMVCPNGNSIQFCLTDVIDFLYDSEPHKNLCDEIIQDYKYLTQLQSEGVDYFEISL